MEKEIRNDRVAARREQVQQARQWLRGQNLSWLVNHLLEKGPKTECALMMGIMDEEFHCEDFAKRSMNILNAVYALWLVKKLWRAPVGIHPGSGEMSHLYGIRNVHPVPKS